MLTHNDVTVKDAQKIFDECKDTKAKFWGFKEVGLPLDQMKKLYADMKKAGKTTFLEVVAYTEPECMMLDPVAKESSISTNRYSFVFHRISSSDSLLKCMEITERSERNSRR